MSKWKMVKLGEVCEIQAGGTPSRGTAIYWENGNIPWIKIGDIKGKFVDEASEYITDAGLANSSAKLFPPDTLLYTIFATLGEAAILRVKAATNQAIAGIIIKNRDEVLMEYLFYALCSIKERVKNIGRGVAQNNINLSILKNIEIPLPPIEEQKRIADILEKASNLIDMRKQQLEKMDLLIKSKFIDMFGDPVTNPKGWDVKKIGELTNVFTGATPNKSIDEYYCGNIPWVKTGEISKEYIWEAEERITKKALKETNCKIFPINTIMVAMYGQGKTRGQAGLLKIEASTNQACAAIVPNESYCTEYLFKLIQLSYETLRSLGRGGNQPNLNLSMIKEFLVMCPPVELQNQFAEFVEQVEKQKAVMQQSLEKMETNYKALMQEYFG
ncbi:MAG: restriction endonuclease subunit S [Negativicutes bacterium]|nr:restriction endonuclease subunit S [Negativicutes bacterium]